MTTSRYVYLVMVAERAGLFGAYLDEDRAHRQAESIHGVVASIPISGDYRDSASEERGQPT